MELQPHADPTKPLRLTFTHVTELAVFRAAYNEDCAKREGYGLDAHWMASSWQNLKPGKHTQLYATLDNMLETALLLRTFAADTDASLAEVEELHAPFQDTETVQLLRQQLGVHATKLADVMCERIWELEGVSGDVLGSSAEAYLLSLPASE